MALISYFKEDPLSINVLFWCDILECNTAFMACPVCNHYPCAQLTAQDLKMLKTSPLMRVVAISFISRRVKKMYIVKKNDGTLAYLKRLDEKKPDPNLLRNVEEIYVIGKILVPVLTLKPKPKEERDRIIKASQSDHQAHRELEAGNIHSLKRKKK
jgi:hypothetical protein